MKAPAIRVILLKQPTTSPPIVNRQNHQRFLKRVHTFWIEGVQEQSLHHTARIELELLERPDALENPWESTIQELQLVPRPLAARNIAQVYDDADGQLLILGEPGAGKTILLLELARILLERAKQDEHHRMPIVLNLSSWAEKRQPLTSWLAEELQVKYHVPRKVAQAWVDTNQVLLLLDGLDEVAKDARVSCIQAINIYYERILEQGPAPLVICCRSQDYMTLPTRIPLQKAISIQPLTEQQIKNYLHHSQGQSEELWQRLCNDPELYKLAHNPLILNIFTLAYQGDITASLPIEKTHDAKLLQIFDTYVERMLHRRSTKMLYSSPQIIYWLAWLAKQMAQHNQTEFYLERIQPDWFLHGWSRHFYNAVVRLGIVLTCEVIFLLPGGLAGGLLFGTLFSLLFGAVFFGLLFGLLFGLTSQVKTTITPAEAVDWSWTTMWRQLVKIELRNALIRVLPGGLVCAFLGGLLLQLLLSEGKVPQSIVNKSPFVNVLISAALCGMLGMFLFGLLNGFADELPHNTATKDHLIISHQGIWHILRNSLPTTLPFGLLVGLVFGLVFWRVIDPINGLLAGLLFGGASMLLFGLTSQRKTKVTWQRL